MATPVSQLRRNSGVPDKIGKYVIVNQVGKGSTGTVYLSHDPYYRRDVAIKVYNIDVDDDPERARVSRKMFFNEAHMVGRLQHPNIMPIYDAGEENGKYYVVTEHVHGARTLSAYCRPDNLLQVDDVVEIVYKVAKALHYAHSRGVIHRDIKPNNIMLTVDNDVRIVDFGIAICKDSEASRIEGIAGSPSYMSPEQVQSEELTSRSDIYSLGAVLYELLTGFRSFRADNLSKLLHQIIYATPAPIHTYRDDIPEELEQIVVMAMQKDPRRRTASGAQMASALSRVYHDLRTRYKLLNQEEHFDMLRTLRFFHDFSHKEILEVMRASSWRNFEPGQEIVREGEMDDRFYIIVTGGADVVANGKVVGAIGNGDCFGETSYVHGAKRAASIIATEPATVLRVSSSQMEQATAATQLRFNKVFLRTLITRLQS